MKHNVLRAAAHNAVDSLTSGCSIAFGMYELPFWSLVARLPSGKLDAELVTGEIRSDIPVQTSAARKLRHALENVAQSLPTFLRQHGCNPKQVQSIDVTFQLDKWRKPRVVITVRQTSGKSATDIYSGTPLMRQRILDHLGLIRSR